MLSSEISACKQKNYSQMLPRLADERPVYRLPEKAVPLELHVKSKQMDDLLTLSDLSALKFSAMNSQYEENKRYEQEKRGSSMLNPTKSQDNGGRTSQLS